ncbi:MAG: hypothetical protein JNL82_08290 [Myxococcales bacterium]|nr:hypothetical protein [Myxococcales bacterium]
MFWRRPIPSCALLLAITACGLGDDSSDAEASGTGETSSGVVTTGQESSSTGGSTGTDATCTPSGVLEAEATRTVEAASVTVSATLLNALEHCPKYELVIELVLDTHSVDLLGYDIIGSASVTTSVGAAVDDGFVWEGGSESSHHRDGTLRVAAPSLVGATWLRLTLPAVAGVDRMFEWEAGLLAHDLP